MAPPSRTLRDYLVPQPQPERPGPTIEAWKKRIPAIEDTRELGLPQPRQAMTSEELENMIMDVATPMGLAGSVRKVEEGIASNLGREIFERSRLIGRPIDFLKEKTALGRLLRAEAEKPLPPAMQNRPIIEGEHSTSSLFRVPEISKKTAGTGAGDFWQGPGFYKSTSVGPSNSVSSSYRESTAFVPQFVKMPSGVVIDRDAVNRLGRKLSKSDPRNAALTNLSVGSETSYFDSPDDVIEDFNNLRQRAIDLQKEIATASSEDKMWLRRDLQEMQDRIGEIRQFMSLGGQPRLPTRIPQDLREATYATQFAANPDELFDLQRFASDQPASERILATLRGMSNPVRPSESLADAAARMQRAGMPAFEINERLVGNKYRDAADMFSGLDRFELMNELNARGIVGNQYLTKFAAENPNLPRTYNYVVQDPSRVRLTDVWAAAPLGLALQRAEQERPAADSTTRSKKR